MTPNQVRCTSFSESSAKYGCSSSYQLEFAARDKPDYHAAALDFLRRALFCERDLKSIIDRLSEVLPVFDVPFLYRLDFARVV